MGEHCSWTLSLCSNAENTQLLQNAWRPLDFLLSGIDLFVRWWKPGSPDGCVYNFANWWRPLFSRSSLANNGQYPKKVDLKRYQSRHVLKTVLPLPLSLILGLLHQTRPGVGGPGWALDFCGCLPGDPAAAAITTLEGIASVPPRTLPGHDGHRVHKAPDTMDTAPTRSGHDGHRAPKANTGPTQELEPRKTMPIKVGACVRWAGACHCTSTK